GGRGGRGGSGGIGTPSGRDGSNGLDGRNGWDGAQGKGGLITVTYDPQVRPFLGASTCPAATDPRQFTKRLRLAQFRKLPLASSFIAQHHDRIYAHRAACGNRAPPAQCRPTKP